MNIEKVSIIVPVYNVEKYLEECLNSILSQTYQNFELILIDDGSKDKSGEICDKYANKYDFITVIHQENQGQSKARNVGIKIARGEWILFVDSDDFLHHDLLKFLFFAVNDSNANMSVCYRIQQSSVPSDFMRERILSYDLIMINEKSLVYLYKNDSINLNTIYWLIYPKLIRADIVKKIPFVEGKIFEDNEVACKWLLESKSVAIVPEDMYFYRNNPTGTMNQPFSIKKLDYLWALEEQIKFYDKLCYENMLNVIGQSYFGTAVYFYDLICENTNDESIKKELRLQIKRVQKTYHSRITISDNVKQKLYKIMKPKTYRLKKIFKHILSLIK